MFDLRKISLHEAIIVAALVGNAVTMWYSHTDFKKHLDQIGHPVLVERVNQLSKEVDYLLRKVD